MGSGHTQTTEAVPGLPCCWVQSRGVPLENGRGTSSGPRAHLHTLLLVLHTVQLVVLVTVFVLTVWQEGDLFQHRAA